LRPWSLRPWTEAEVSKAFRAAFLLILPPWCAFFACSAYYSKRIAWTRFFSSLKSLS
jgi:hypothetical protein